MMFRHTWVDLTYPEAVDIPRDLSGMHAYQELAFYRNEVSTSVPGAKYHVSCMLVLSYVS
jgi:hypothetical protein